MSYQDSKKKDGSLQIEREAFLLAKSFLERYKKLDFRTFRISKVKESKWWKHFVSCVELRSSKKEWDTKRFIDIQFNEFGKILPFHLPTKKAWDIYIEYYRRGEVDKEKAVALGLLNSYKKIKKFGTYKDFFNDKKNMLFVIRGELSPYFLSISRSFLKVYANLTENQKKNIISKEKLKISRAMVFSNRKILNKIKEALGKEFI